MTCPKVNPVTSGVRSEGDEGYEETARRENGFLQ